MTLLNWIPNQRVLIDILVLQSDFLATCRPRIITNLLLFVLIEGRERSKRRIFLIVTLLGLFDAFLEVPDESKFKWLDYLLIIILN